MSLKNYKLSIQLTAEQFEVFRRQYSSSECHSYSAFGRKMILREPINLSHRNKSFDDFVDETVRLRKDLRNLLEGNVFSPERQEGLLQVLEKIKLATYKLADHVCKNWKNPES